MRSYSAAERTAFLLTLVAVLFLALLPATRLKELGLDIGFHYDKLNHATAFVILTILGTLGWPDRKAWVVIFLAFVGAAIEVIQGSALVARDLDVLDWVADCFGIAFGVAAVTGAQWIARRVT